MYVFDSQSWKQRVVEEAQQRSSGLLTSLHAAHAEIAQLKAVSSLPQP